MTNKTSQQPIFSHVKVYYEVAKDSYDSMIYHLESNRRPKIDGGVGWTIKFDPERKSFKKALITIVFTGVFLEALLHLLIVKHKGIKVFKEIDKKKNYEGKLELLGCEDPEILGLCKNLREARREIVHEKAHLDDEFFRDAQDEAKKAIILVNKLITFFSLNFDK